MTPVRPGEAPTGLAPVEPGFVPQKAGAPGRGPHRARPGGSRVRPQVAAVSVVSAPTGLAPVEPGIVPSGVVH